MLEQYGIKKWGEGYFDINSKGNVVVRPNQDGKEGDLFELVKTLVAQGIEAPILIRFNGIIRDRIQQLSAAFQNAIKESNYRNEHRMAFPIKVNPQRHVVEIVQQAGKEKIIGIEVGSKPELIAVLALENTPDSYILCNGYKDVEYISFALMANKLGMKTLIIIEQAYELKLVLDEAEKLGVEAQIGFRMKLSNKGTGKWQSSGGEHSKFGLFSYEIMACLDQLKAKGKKDWVKLLHFHIGSQITTIQSIKKALKEAARMYTELARELPSLNIFDVGGGLAVDYDGSKSSLDSSMNYTIEEYARDVVYVIGQACLAAGIPDPLIITESGRAIVTHHSVLITEVIDVASANLAEIATPPSHHEIIETLLSMDQELSLKNCREAFHDVMELKERILEEFIHGKLTLAERAFAEKVTRSLLVKIRSSFKHLPEIPEEMEGLDRTLLETYFCNFSVFQSLPDSWAITQIFPIMPIHRLNDVPHHQAVLADLSCDSDGKIDSFIGKHKEPAHYIKLHEYAGGAYYIGIFLVGAYQEILGGLHNLFGDTNVVHAELDENGNWELSRLVEGDTIEEVLHYVQYNTEKLMNQLQVLIERSLKSGRLSPEESAQVKKKFKQSLESYTYLVV